MGSVVWKGVVETSPCGGGNAKGQEVQEMGDIDSDIDHRIRVGWQKWRNASRVLCEKKIPVRLKGRVYCMIVRPAMLYGAKCWPIKRLMVADMRMIRWMCSYTRLDKIRNVIFKEKVEVAPIEEKMRETRLIWLGHVTRRSVEAPVRRCEKIDLRHYRRERGRPKTSWNKVIRGNLDFLAYSWSDLEHITTCCSRYVFVPLVSKFN